MKTHRINELFKLIAFACLFITVTCSADSLSEENVRTLAKTWAQYTNEHNYEGMIELLTPESIISIYSASDLSKPTAILTVESYEKLLKLPESKRKLIKYLRNTESVLLPDGNYDASATVNVMETYQEGKNISHIKSLEKISFSIIRGKLKIMRIDVIVGI